MENKHTTNMLKATSVIFMVLAAVIVLAGYGVGLLFVALGINGTYTGGTGGWMIAYLVAALGIIGMCAPLLLVGAFEFTVGVMGFDAARKRKRPTAAFALGISNAVLATALLLGSLASKFGLIALGGSPYSLFAFSAQAVGDSAFLCVGAVMLVLSCVYLVGARKIG